MLILSIVEPIFYVTVPLVAVLVVMNVLFKSISYLFGFYFLLRVYL